MPPRMSKPRFHGRRDSCRPTFPNPLLPEDQSERSADLLYRAGERYDDRRGDLYDYGNTQLGQQIAIINGVSQVQVYGARSAIRIKVRVNQLSSLGLTMTDVTNAVGQSTAYLGAGQLDGKNRTYLLFPNRQFALAGTEVARQSATSRQGISRRGIKI